MEPLEHGIDQITVKVRDELREHVGHQEPKIVSDQNTPMLARQLAIHTDVSYCFIIYLINCVLKMGISFKIMFLLACIVFLCDIHSIIYNF